MKLLAYLKTHKNTFLAALVFGVALTTIPFVVHADIGDWLSPFVWSNFLIAQVGTVVLWIVGILVVLAGWLLDLSIWISVANFSQYAEMPIIRIGWTIIRDLCNIFFIFAILYIAISTILQLSHESIGKLLVRVIIAALLINFSFPITLLVIDASNVVSYGFYKKMGGGEFNPFDRELSIASRIIGGLQLPGTIKSLEDPGKMGAAFRKMNMLPIILNTLGGIAVELIVAIVLLIAALLFLLRTVAFLFLLMLSPFGFLAMAVPGLNSIGEEWRGSLFKYALSAPAFLFMFYIATSLIAGGDGSLRAMLIPDDPGLGNMWQSYFAAVTGGIVQKENFNILLYFVISIGFFIGTLMVGAKMGAAGAAAAEHAIIGAGKSAAGWLGDNTYGRAARKIRRSEALSKFAEKEYTGRFAATRNALKNWSVKNVMYQPLKKAAGGFDSSVLKNIKENEAMAEDLGRNDDGSNRRTRPDLIGKSAAEIAIIKAEEQKRLAELKKNMELVTAEYKAGRLTEERYKQVMSTYKPEYDQLKKQHKGDRLRNIILGKMNPKSLGYFEDYAVQHTQHARDAKDGMAVMKEAIEKLRLGIDGSVGRAVSHHVREEIEQHLDPRLIKEWIKDPNGRKDAQGNIMEILVVNAQHKNYNGTQDINQVVRTAQATQKELQELIDDAHTTLVAGEGGGHDSDH